MVACRGTGWSALCHRKMVLTQCHLWKSRHRKNHTQDAASPTGEDALRPGCTSQSPMSRPGPSHPALPREAPAGQVWVGPGVPGDAHPTHGLTHPGRPVGREPVPSGSPLRVLPLVSFTFIIRL